MTQITDAMIEAGIEAWQKVPVGEACDYSVVMTAIYTAMHRASSIPEPEAASPKLVEAATALSDFAWGPCVTTDCDESREYLQSLIDNLRAALAIARPEAASSDEDATEAVARAIRARQVGYDDWDGTNEHQRDAFRSDADAAIAAMPRLSAEPEAVTLKLVEAATFAHRTLVEQRVAHVLREDVRAGGLADMISAVVNKLRAALTNVSSRATK